MAEYTITKKISCCDFSDLSENLKAEVKEKYFLDTVHSFLRDELEIFSNEISINYGYYFSSHPDMPDCFLYIPLTDEEF